MSPRIAIGRYCGLLLLLLLVNIVTVSLADENSNLTVVNKTTRYIHVIVDGEPYLYVAPERAVIHQAPATATMLVTAFYSPGQGLTGSLIDTIDVPYRAAREGCACDEGDWGECYYTPAAGGAVRLEVRPEDLNDGG